MLVTVTEQCDRCKREAPKQVDSRDIADLEAAEVLQQSVEEQIRDFFSALDGPLPSALTLCNGNVRMMFNVCDAHCIKPVENALATIYREERPHQRKTAEGVNSVEGAEPSDEEPKKKGKKKQQSLAV